MQRLRVGRSEFPTSFAQVREFKIQQCRDCLKVWIGANEADNSEQTHRSNIMADCCVLLSRLVVLLGLLAFVAVRAQFFSFSDIYDSLPDKAVNSSSSFHHSKQPECFNPNHSRTTYEWIRRQILYTLYVVEWTGQNAGIFVKVYCSWLQYCTWLT